MAEVVGFLRDDATHGEKQTFKLLRHNLPKEFTVYVETPVRKKRELRYPDFIILTNYGVIVLEVKDWVAVERVEPAGATIRTTKGEVRWASNPVSIARDYAIALSNELNSRLHDGQSGEAIPWGYAAVLINLPASVITQLRRPWGEEFVFGEADLENPDVLLSRLKNTFPLRYIRSLTKAELDQVRATIYPVVDIQINGLPQFVLDEQQEKLVAETPRHEVEAKDKKGAAAQQQQLFSPAPPLEPQVEEISPVEGDRISQNIAIRLVRGFSGSGKTLVLIQRARFLAAQYPEWKIGVLTYNKPLQQQLEQTFRGTAIQPRTFHSLCGRLADTPADQEVNLADWVKEHTPQYPVLQKFSSEFICHEIDWLRDMGVPGRDEYLALERRGIGREQRLLASDRQALYDVLEAYRAYLRDHCYWDWPEMPLIALETLSHCPLQESEYYDAILIDEAQDWAPVWFKVVTQMVHPEHGLIFLADDPSQSIYRYFSWKEKGIAVVGRTRWLRVPYRNTYEIYRAAYSMIADHAEIQNSLAEEGERVEPQLSSQEMRHGETPLLRRCKNGMDELFYLRTQVESLRREGYSGKQIAVLARYKRDLESIQNTLRGTGVEPSMIHSYKGLEMEAVIIPHLQNTFQKNADETNERRLMYMAMSRARSRLYLTYSGRLPQVYHTWRHQGVVDFVE